MVSVLSNGFGSWCISELNGGIFSIFTFSSLLTKREASWMDFGCICLQKLPNFARAFGTRKARSLWLVRLSEPEMQQPFVTCDNTQTSVLLQTTFWRAFRYISFKQPPVVPLVHLAFNGYNTVKYWCTAWSKVSTCGHVCFVVSKFLRVLPTHFLFVD